MVLLVPKALAKQIMCINTRRTEEGRGVSRKNEAPKGGRRPKPSVLVEAVGQRPRTLREERKALLFPPETRTGNGKELLALALF